MTRADARSWYWPALVAVLLVASGYNLAVRLQLAGRVAQIQRQNTERQRVSVERERTVAGLVGRRLRWPVGLRDLAGHDGWSNVPTAPRYRLIAVLSGQQCTTQRTAVTLLLERLQANLRNKRDPGAILRAVLFVPEAQTAEGYAIGNAFVFPVLFDPEHRFARENAIPIEPMVMVVDSEDVVVAALSPVGQTTDLWSVSAASVMALFDSSGTI